MNIRLSSTHLKTLTKLHEMAEKHNCLISFGINNQSDTDLDDELLIEKAGLSKKLYNKLTELTLKNVHSQNQQYYYTLFDKNNRTYHSLSLYQASISFFYNEDDTDSDKLLSWLEDYSNESWLSERFFYYSTDYQTISGFDNVDKTNISVYREGMLLKFFGDLVCDYLGEERIQEVY